MSWRASEFSSPPSSSKSSDVVLPQSCMSGSNMEWLSLVASFFLLACSCLPSVCWSPTNSTWEYRRHWKSCWMQFLSCLWTYHCRLFSECDLRQDEATWRGVLLSFIPDFLSTFWCSSHPLRFQIGLRHKHARHQSTFMWNHACIFLLHAVLHGHDKYCEVHVLLRGLGHRMLAVHAASTAVGTAGAGRHGAGFHRHARGLGPLHHLIHGCFPRPRHRARSRSDAQERETRGAHSTLCSDCG